LALGIKWVLGGLDQKNLSRREGIEFGIGFGRRVDVNGAK
jgi:hypothetical protein